MSKQPIDEDENGIIALRMQKLQVLRDQGNAFSNDFRRSHLASELHKQCGDMSKEVLADSQLATRAAGRILLKRV
ncbi:MAG: lysine--tRNA ligase, partial [Pseudomonadota bacterium]|nr:lysine--tRNA ligase [Pseudomonadota bacterium]